jgi:predicted RNase H-like nuclease (RuvC/YqgF family)
MAYEDDILIRLRREYSKDEVVAFSLKKISELQIENGKLKSYIQELEFVPVKTPDEIRLVKQENTISNLNMKIKKLREELKIARFWMANNTNAELKITSLEKKLETKSFHFKMSDEKNKFYYEKIKSVLSDSELEDFITERNLLFKAR